ncbi:MAG: glycine oxidase ThiO [Pseudomonadales bacterium]|nr:glycine oxidase ThiO [Pseudomonadales bacterium]
MQVVVIGGGVIGMMQARALAAEGVSVILIERGLCGKEASWAGGGIVSPLYPWRYSDPVTTLANWSQTYYANLSESLEAESGIDPELSRTGLLMLSIFDQQEALKWGAEHSYQMQMIGADEIYHLEPKLKAGFKQAIWMPQVANIRNPRLARSLRAVLEHDSRVTICEEQAVLEIQTTKQGRVEGVLTDKGIVQSDAVVLASGAWSGKLLESLSISLPIEPVKGQMVLFKGEPGVVRRIVLRDGKYIIPRRDGHVLAGSTLEYCGFDKSTTASAREELADIAIDMLPELSSFQLEAQWAGLRPGIEGGIPLIGEVESHPGLFLNCGHFRNGLVLAPASVQLLTSLIMQSEHPFSPEPYSPSRSSNGLIFM